MMLKRVSKQGAYEEDKELTTSKECTKSVKESRI